MEKFKVGDKVRTTKVCIEMNGEKVHEGIVREITQMIWSDWGDGKGHSIQYIRGVDLELVKPKRKRIIHPSHGRKIITM